MHLHSILSGKIKRGKGRPKGSNNKQKASKVFVKIEEEDNVFHLLEEDEKVGSLCFMILD